MQKIKDFLGKVKDWSVAILYCIRLFCIWVKWLSTTIFGALKRAIKMWKDETIDEETGESILSAYLDCKSVELSQKVDNLTDRLEKKYY